MRHIETKHFETLSAGALPCNVHDAAVTRYISLEDALRRVWKPGPDRGGDRPTVLDVSLPEPLHKTVDEKRMETILLAAVNQARCTNLLRKSRPVRNRAPKHRLRVTPPAWLASSLKLIAHCCEVPVSDVAAWAVELQSGGAS